jgi:hypothetical protein
MPVVSRESARDRVRERVRERARESGATRRVRRRWVVASSVLAILLAAALLVTCPGHVHGGSLSAGQDGRTSWVGGGRGSR